MRDGQDHVLRKSKKGGYGVTKEEKIDKYGEVFTPEWVVRKMCDMMEQESGDAFLPEKTFLEPSCGEGIFIIEILRRKFQHCKTKEDYMTSVRSVYGFEIQTDNVEKCIRNVIDFCGQHFKVTKRDEMEIGDHVILCDGLKIMKMLAEGKEKAKPS